MSGDDYRFGRYVPAEQVPPAPKRVTDQVVQRFEHVFEVDPERMTRFQQQKMPTWDTRRIVAARWDHLDAVHREFADEVLLAGEGPDPGPESTQDEGKGANE
ncbi:MULTISPECIES: hypothetical protein [Prauserella]|uniref:hypothetical protein n=1 Tax=Prauserella TaxID=142577 RepID=UPI0018F6DA16|nr:MULTISPECIES: hypothetical protein [Prauserella]